MANSKSSKSEKGKRRASRTPSPHPLSSDDVMELPATQPTRSRKKLRRQSSQERVMGSVLSKATKKGTGLAALVALVATRGPVGSTEAKEETIRGMKTGAKRPKAKNGTRSNITVCYNLSMTSCFCCDLTILLHKGDGFRVGKIAFLREGVKTVSMIFRADFLWANICSRRNFLTKATLMNPEMTYDPSILHSQRSR